MFRVFYHDPAEGRRELFNGTARWYAHRDFDSSASGAAHANADVAVIRFPRRFPGTDYRDYLRLYAGENDRLKRRLDAYGAGRYTYSGKTDNNLRTQGFSVEHVKRNHIVVDTRKRVGLCKGDSGGPLIYPIAHPARAIPTVVGVASWIELFGGEGDICSNNDFGIDDAFYSRTNWEKLSSLMGAAGLECDPLSASGVAYRRCFELPLIEDVEWEGRDQGEGVSIAISAIGR